MAKRPAEIQQQSSKIKVKKFKMVPISRLPVVVAPSASRSKAGTWTKRGNVNVSSDVNLATNVEENNSDDQEDDRFSCLEN